jgi:hypothetical protein
MLLPTMMNTSHVMKSPVPIYGPNWGRFRVDFPTKPKSLLRPNEASYFVNGPIGSLGSAAGLQPLPPPNAYAVILAHEGEKKAYEAVPLLSWGFVDGKPGAAAIGKETLLAQLPADVTDAKAI